MNKPFDPRRSFDMTISDPPFVDPDFPPEQFVAHFKSGGKTVHATIWKPDGPDPKPCVIISPQIFGGDRLESLIIPLLGSGIGVCTFHPRGMWDGHSDYSFISALEDIRAATAFIAGIAESGLRTPRGNPCPFDPTRIVAAGLSGGGGSLSLAACAEDDALIGAVAVAAGNFELNRAPPSLDPVPTFYSYIHSISDGRINVSKWLSELTPADIDRISPIARAPDLVNKKVLLVSGQRDTSTPIETAHRPIAAAFRAAGVEGFTEVIMEADHAFLTKRIALARLVIAWLRAECGF